ncbi:hypothetical protein [Methanolacinia petrolearia]|uniref:hypothetical protein n=1 Tax=Methanolacinia petrolearia TaxID=54120 RepID=UPI001651320E|nr:hypothetical protein [Methanolacinia petrolearia]
MVIPTTGAYPKKLLGSFYHDLTEGSGLPPYINISYWRKIDYIIYIQQVDKNPTTAYRS